LVALIVGILSLYSHVYKCAVRCSYKALEVDYCLGGEVNGPRLAGHLLAPYLWSSFAQAA
jgi:hypothetical protein